MVRLSRESQKGVLSIDNAPFISFSGHASKDNGYVSPRSHLQLLRYPCRCHSRFPPQTQADPRLLRVSLRPVEQLPACPSQSSRFLDQQSSAWACSDSLISVPKCSKRSRPAFHSVTSCLFHRHHSPCPQSFVFSGLWFLCHFVAIHPDARSLH